MRFLFLCFALLWGAAGFAPVCSGSTASDIAAAGAASGEPYDFKKEPLDKEFRFILEELGHVFVVEGKSGHILSLDKQKLSKARVRAYLEPVDFRKREIKPEFQDRLIVAGYRFDEGKGYLFSPKTKKPLNQAEMELTFKYLTLGHKHVLLERAYSMLGPDMDYSRPLPPDVASKMKNLINLEEGTMPAQLVWALKNTQRLPAEMVRASLERAYSDSMKFWDQRSEWEADGAQLVVARLRSQKIPAYYDDTEKELGEALAQDVVSHLSKNPVGAELLEKFPKEKGKPKLPAFLVLEIDSRNKAFYSPAGKSIVLSRQQVWLEALSIGRDRGKDLPDPKKPAQFLLDHPEKRAELVRRYDVAIFHELVHAWQDRQEPIHVEMLRGSLPGADVLEYEHEAFREQNRYLHSKLMADPSSAAGSPWLGDYLGMLSNFYRWREGISRRYLQDSPQFAAGFHTVRKIQEARSGLIGKLIGSSSYDEASFLRAKLRAMKRANPKLEKAKSKSLERRERFMEEELPKMREEGFQKLIGHFKASGRRDNAFYVFQHREASRLGLSPMPEEVESARKGIAREALQTAVWLEKSAKGLALEDRLQIASALADFYDDWGKPRPEAVRDAVRKAFREKALNLLARARGAKTSTFRAHYLERAEHYAVKARDYEILGRISRLRSKKKAPARR